MLTVLSFLVTNKYGKYVLELVVVAGLIFGAYKWAEHKGSEHQKTQDEQKQTEAIEKSRKEADDAKNQVVALANDKANAAESRAQQAQQQFAILANTLTTLANKSQAGHEQVSKLSDSDLHGDIVTKLGIRKPNDPTPGYLPQEERAIDDTITQYPIVQQENVTLQGQVVAKTSEAQSNLDLANARQEIIAANNKYTQKLEEDYKTLYNMHPPRYRGGACLFLWKCGKKELK